MVTQTEQISELQNKISELQQKTGEMRLIETTISTQLSMLTDSVEKLIVVATGENGLTTRLTRLEVMLEQAKKDIEKLEAGLKQNENKTWTLTMRIIAIASGSAAAGGAGAALMKILG